MSEETQTIEEGKGAGGVKTAEGKAISRYNAQKHAILRETITDYEKKDAEQFFNELAEAIKPRGRFQELMVENIASNAIRLQRIARAEAELIKEMLAPDIHGVRSLTFKTYRPVMEEKIIEKLDLYSRYQTAAENRIYRAMALLKGLQNYEKAD